MSNLNESQYKDEKEAITFSITLWEKVKEDIAGAPDIPLYLSKEEGYILNGYNPEKDTALCPLCAIYSTCMDCALYGKLQAKGDDYLPVDRCGDDGSAFIEVIRIKDKDERLKGATHIIKELKNYLGQMK